MKHYLNILSLIFILAFGCCSKTVANNENMRIQYGEEASSADLFSENKAEDAIWYADGSHKDNGAYIIESTEANRVCNSRPQRILPIFDYRTGKTIGKYSFNYYLTNLFYTLFGNNSRIESSPFQSAASRSYYVIALRHLIC
jgi:hypothetical protein